MSFTIQKENPILGIFKFDLSKDKRTITKSYSNARFFRLYLGPRKRSRWYEIPEGYDKAKQKRIYCKAFLIGYHQTIELKKEARRRRYAARREAEGKSYTPKARKMPPHKALRISKAELEIIERTLGPEIREVKEVFHAPDEIKQVVSEDQFNGRFENLIQVLRKEYKEAGQNFNEIAIGSNLSPTSEGKATPFRKGQPSNWRTLQKEAGIEDQESINWVVTRFIRHEGIPFFKRVAKKFPRAKEFYYGISMVTNLREHEHLMRGNFAEAEMNVAINLRESKDFLWSKKHIAQIEWRFVQVFMKTLYRGDGEMFRAGELTSSGVLFQQALGERAKGKPRKPTKNFRLGFVISLGETAR